MTVAEKFKSDNDTVLRWRAFCSECSEELWEALVTTKPNMAFVLDSGDGVIVFKRDVPDI